MQSYNQKVIGFTGVYIFYVLTWTHFFGSSNAPKLISHVLIKYVLCAQYTLYLQIIYLIYNGLYENKQYFKSYKLPLQEITKPVENDLNNEYNMVK